MMTQDEHCEMLDECGHLAQAIRDKTQLFTLDDQSVLQELRDRLTDIVGILNTCSVDHSVDVPKAEAYDPTAEVADVPGEGLFVLLDGKRIARRERDQWTMLERGLTVRDMDGCVLIQWDDGSVFLLTEGDLADLSLTPSQRSH